MNQYSQPASQPASPPLVPVETMRRILGAVTAVRPQADAVAVSHAINLAWAARGRAEGMGRG